jgi:hypothetical protein
VFLALPFADDGSSGFLAGPLFLLVIPFTLLFVVLMLTAVELYGLQSPEWEATNFDRQQAMTTGFVPPHDAWAGTRLVLRRPAATTKDSPVMAAPGMETEAPLARLGPYDLVRQLGAGAMGTVFLAWDRAVGRPVAVKVISRPSEPGESRERFEREALLAAQVSHCNVASVFETGGWDAEPYIAMEFIDGESLKARVERQGPLPLAEAWDCIIQIAQGLQAADRAGVVHRDVKPANAMINREGVVKLTDFGVSRTTQAGIPGITQQGGVVGTPIYMPPEQARGQKVDRRSDMYALGMTLYYLLTGRTAFTALSREDLLALQLTTDPEPLLSKVPGLNSAQDALIRRLLARDREQRFPDYETLLDELREESPERWVPASALLRMVDGLYFCGMAVSLLMNPLYVLAIGGALASQGTYYFRDALPILFNPFYLLGWQAVVVVVGVASLVLRPGFPRRPQPGQTDRWALLRILRVLLIWLTLSLTIFWPVFHKGSGFRVAPIGGRPLSTGRSLTRILVNFPVLLPWPAVVLLAGVPVMTCWLVVVAVSVAIAVVNAFLLLVSPRRLVGDLAAGTAVERMLPPAFSSPVVPTSSPVVPSKARSQLPAVVASFIFLALVAWTLVDYKNRTTHEREQARVQATQTMLQFIGGYLQDREQLIRDTQANAPPGELLRIRQEGAALLRSFEGKNLIVAPRFPGSSLGFLWEVTPAADWPLGRPEALLAFEPRPDDQGGRYVLMGDGKTVRYLPEEEFQRLLGR